MKCENCCYFGYTEDKEWKDSKGNNICHCMFTELRGDYETAPCDEPDYEENDDVETHLEEMETVYHKNPLDDDDFDTDDYVFDIPSDAF